MIKISNEIDARIIDLSETRIIGVKIVPIGRVLVRTILRLIKKFQKD